MAARGGWYLLFLWPAVSFGIVAISYLSGDADWFGKRSDGTRSTFSTCALLPFLLFAHIVWLIQIWLSREPAIASVNKSLIISRRLLVRELPKHVTEICDLTCEFVAPISIRSRLGYLCHPILDAGICSAGELIELARCLPPADGEVLLIHCANGHGRTGMFAAIWLLTHGFVDTVDEALEILRDVRPGVILRARQFQVVEEALEQLRL